MSAVETGQMSAAETGQMSAVETGQMSAETGQMSAVETLVTGHWSLHHSYQLIVGKALRADASQPGTMAPTGRRAT